MEKLFEVGDTIEMLGITYRVIDVSVKDRMYLLSPMSNGVVERRISDWFYESTLRFDDAKLLPRNST